MSEPMADPALARLADQVHTARATRGTLCIQGGGSKAGLGPAPVGEPLATAALAGISSHQPSELVVSVRAGTPLAELEAALAAHGQCLAFEPPRLGPGGTVGGMVAAGLAGPARAAVGGVRDFVLGATLMNGRAEVLSFGGQVMKNVAGYDLARVLAGSWGALGIILEVSLKVLPRPAAQATVRLELGQAEALALLNRLGGQPLPLSASAWWQGMLVLRWAGAEAAVRAALQRQGGELIAPESASTFWLGLRDQQDEFFSTAAQAVAAGGQRLWRLGLPSTAPALALPGELLVEWGGAQRWLLTDATPEAVRAATAAVGGHATVWRGDSACGVQAPLGEPLRGIHQRLKQAFDPDAVFGPGRLVLA